MKDIKNKIKVLELEIDLLSKSLNKLKEEVEIDLKRMNSIDGKITFKAFGYDNWIEARKSGIFADQSIWLNSKFKWEIVIDDFGCECLITTGLSKEEG